LYAMSADQLTHRNKISFLHKHLCLWNRSDDKQLFG